MSSPAPPPQPNGNPSPLVCFTDSGHQFHFVPLSEDYLKKYPNAGESCQLDNDPWRPTDPMKWIRFRHGMNDSVAGIWLAVETNLGTKERGFLWEPKRETGRQPLPPGFDPQDTPYAAADAKYLQATRLRIGLGNSDLKIEIVWQLPAVQTPRDVDLVVDFGNSRSVALLLEDDRNKRFADNCHPVRFIERGTEYEPFTEGHASDDPCVIVDSWVILQEPMFSTSEPPAAGFSPEVHSQVEEVTVGHLFWKKQVKRIVAETKYIPQMFVELSPALLGGGTGLVNARKVLRDVQLDQGANFFLSSPKRYAWDHDPVGGGEREGFWCMALNRWNPLSGKANTGSLPLLQGQILRFMPPDGSDWPIEDPPINRPREQQPHANDQPTHPNSDALTWVALAILERAYAQINSKRYREELASPFVPRRLRSVLVTFPAGWSSAELDCYKAKWQKAINIFTLGHLPDQNLEGGGRCRPQLITNLDEAVASQLPMIYSEIVRMPGGESWIELVGRGCGNDAHVRAMNIDIGGGTTDISIVDYTDELPGGQVHLIATTLFKNSSTTAGDVLVKLIIEKVLLAKLGDRFGKDTPERERFEQFFGHPPAIWLAKVPAFHKKLARIIRLVFLPIVNAWLKETAQDRYGNPDKNNQAYSPGDMRLDDGSAAVDKALVDELNTLMAKLIGSETGPSLEILPFDQALHYDQPVLKQCIGEVFRPLFRSLAKLVAAFDCDLVFVSGKPSELNDVHTMLCRELPLLPQRIISAKDFPAGGWYPLSAGDGCIHDAKTVTVVGASLYQAMQIGLISGWKLTCKTDTALFSKNIWGDSKQTNFDKNLFLGLEESEATVRMLLGTCIGRKRYASREVLPDQVYKLRWKNPKRAAAKMTVLQVTLQREQQEGAAEALQIVAVTGTDDHGQPVTKDDVELQVCTLPDEGFWMDHPCLDVRWNE